MVPLLILPNITGDAVEQFFFWLTTIVVLPMCLSMLCFQRWFLFSLLWDGLGDVLIGCCKWLPLKEFSIDMFIANIANGNLIVLFCCIIYFDRQRTLKQAQVLVSNDQAKYNGLWDRLMEDPQAKAGLEALERLVERIPRPPGPLRQLAHTDRFSRVESLTSKVAGRLQGYFAMSEQFDDDLEPIQSLDRLFSQAGFMDHILIRKCQQLAGASAGLFPCNQDEWTESVGLVAWKEAEQEAKLRERIRWAKPKSEERALAKCVSWKGRNFETISRKKKETEFINDASNRFRV